MSFDAYKEFIGENDTVILYISFNTMHSVKVTPTKETKKGEVVENVFQTSYGALKVKDLIGQRFGTKVQMSKAQWIILLISCALKTKHDRESS